MLKIGEFAQVGRVSVATLRYYDQYGLLKPSALDRDTGYRYYALDQLPRLNRILALKDLGFPLYEIARLLETDLSLEHLRDMRMAKQAHSQRVIEMERARLARIAARLRQIEQEETMPRYDVLLKHVDPIRVGSVRARIPIILVSLSLVSAAICMRRSQPIWTATACGKHGRTCSCCTPDTRCAMTRCRSMWRSRCLCRRPCPCPITSRSASARCPAD